MDPVQLAISLMSITLLAFLAAKLFPVKEVLNLASVQAEYQRYNPEAVIDTIILGLDHKAALLKLTQPQDQLGIVTRLGDRLVCRTVGKDDIASFAVSGDTLTINSDDFTQPYVSIRLDPDEMQSAQRLITSFTEPEGATHANQSA